VHLVGFYDASVPQL